MLIVVVIYFKELLIVNFINREFKGFDCCMNTCSTNLLKNRKNITFLQ